MDRHATYDKNNIFARMLRGEMACYKVYEDDDVFALLDIMPLSEGHTLVLPKEPAMNLMDISPETLSKLIVVTQMLAGKVMSAVEAEGVQIIQRSFEAAGQEVFHFHMHVIPRFKGEPLRERDLVPDQALKTIQSKIVAAVG